MGWDYDETWRGIPIPTAIESLIVAALWIGAIFASAWPSTVLFVLASLGSLHLLMTAIMLIGAGVAMRSLDEAVRQAKRKQR